MKPLAALLPPAQDISHPFVQCVLPVSRSLAISLARLTVLVSQCLYSSDPFNLLMAPRYKSSDAGNLDTPQSNHTVKVLDVLRKEYNMLWLLRKVYSKNKSSTHEIVKKEKEICVSFAVAKV